MSSAPTTARGEDPTEATRKVRVLLAHEEPLFRDLLKGILDGQTDLEVSAEAGDGLDAVTLVQEVRPDVVILSAHLPSLDGIRCTYLIKERAPECRVIILNDQDSEKTLVEALEAGASGYLTKASSSQEVIEAMRPSPAERIDIPQHMQQNLLVQLVHQLARRDELNDQISLLTPRERETLALLVEGASTRAIAEALVISPETARTHVQNTLAKLGVHSRLQAVAMIRRDGGLERLLRRRAGRSAARLKQTAIGDG